MNKSSSRLADSDSLSTVAWKLNRGNLAVIMVVELPLP